MSDTKLVPDDEELVARLTQDIHDEMPMYYPASWEHAEEAAKAALRALAAALESR